MEHNELIKMKSIPMDERKNIGIEEMKEYDFGGLTIESLEKNGALVYIPYGVYVDIFRAIKKSITLIKKEIKEEQNKDSSDSLENIADLKNKLDIFENIYPLINEV